MRNKTMEPKLGEAYFDIVYLLLALGFGIYFVTTADNTSRLLWGMMSFVLVAGDAFHLIPRIAAAFKKNTEKYAKAMGRGRQVASISMSLFYLILWQVGSHYLTIQTALTLFMYALAVIRIALCLLPQNGWTSETPSYTYSIVRNVPFLLQAVLIMWMFSNAVLRATPGLELVWLAVMLSFECYIVVVLFAPKKPLLGILMLPKTVAYVWLLSMGLSL